MRVRQSESEAAVLCHRLTEHLSQLCNLFLYLRVNLLPITKQCSIVLRHVVVYTFRVLTP